MENHTDIDSPQLKRARLQEGKEKENGSEGCTDSASSRPECSEEQMQVFMQWAQQHGAIIDSMDVTHTPDKGWIVKAMRDVKKNEPFLNIPSSFLLSAESALKQPVGQAILSCPAIEKPVPALALILCELVYARFHPSRSSFWCPYAASLPSQFDTPLWYSESELQWLQGTNIYHSLGDERAKVERVCNALFPHLHTHDAALFPPHVFTLSNMVWAYSAYTTRALPDRLLRSHVPSAITIPPQLGVMVPVLDLCNHSPASRVTWACTDGHVTLAQDAGVHCGDEYLNNYGLKSNEELLMGYGFCLPDNPKDEAVLRMVLEYGPRASVLSSMGLHVPTSSAIRVEVALDGALNAPTLPSLRMRVATDDDIAVLNMNGSSTVFEQPLPTPDRELMVLDVLRAEMERRLQGLPLLEQPFTSHRQHTCALYVAGVRRCLQEGIITLHRRSKECRARSPLPPIDPAVALSVGSGPFLSLAGSPSSQITRVVGATLRGTVIASCTGMTSAAVLEISSFNLAVRKAAWPSEEALLAVFLLFATRNPAGLPSDWVEFATHMVAAQHPSRDTTRALASGALTPHPLFPAWSQLVQELFEELAETEAAVRSCKKLPKDVFNRVDLAWALAVVRCCAWETETGLSVLPWPGFFRRHAVPTAEVVGGEDGLMHVVALCDLDDGDELVVITDLTQTEDLLLRYGQPYVQNPWEKVLLGPGETEWLRYDGSPVPLCTCVADACPLVDVCKRIHQAVQTLHQPTTDHSTDLATQPDAPPNTPHTTHQNPHVTTPTLLGVVAASHAWVVRQYAARVGCSAVTV